MQTMADPTSFWFTGGHVVDVRGGTVRRDTNVEIVAGSISQVTAAAPPAGVRTKPLGGRYLLPGLISAHTHLSVVYPFDDTVEGESPGITALRALGNAQEALRAGVTTIRCVHEQNRADLLIRTAAEQGWVSAPRILGAGRAVSTTGGHGHSHGMTCSYADGYDGFLHAARAELAAGADHVKIFITGGMMREGESFDSPEMTFDEMRATVDAAEQHGTYVVAHAGSGTAIKRALKAGVRSFEHAYQLDDETITEMSRRQVFLTPTLCVSRCPDWMAEHHFPAWQIERAMQVGVGHLASIRAAVSEGFGNDDSKGITFISGTDYLPGSAIEDTIVAVREMEFLTDAGLSPHFALRAGTLDAARLIRMADRLGAVEPGYLADLIVTDADPLSDLTALRHIRLVMQAGAIVRDDVPARIIVGTPA